MTNKINKIFKISIVIIFATPIALVVMIICLCLLTICHIFTDTIDQFQRMYSIFKNKIYKIWSEKK
jgi:hypothetical protein